MIGFVVPNDEDGDTVFMPIKSNDDDEPVGFKERIYRWLGNVYLVDYW